MPRPRAVVPPSPLLLIMPPCPPSQVINPDDLNDCNPRALTKDRLREMMVEEIRLTHSEFERAAADKALAKAKAAASAPLAAQPEPDAPRGPARTAPRAHSPPRPKQGTRAV